MAFRHPVNIIYLWINQTVKAGMIFTLLQSELFASKMHLFYREKGPIGDVYRKKNRNAGTGLATGHAP